MRKRQISPTPPGVVPSGQAWLDVDRTVFVEVTSEENGYPIEFCAVRGGKLGLACGKFRDSDNPANFRRATKAQAYLVGF
jgi:hypothetical protein